MEPFVSGLLQKFKANKDALQTLTILQAACGSDLESILGEIDAIYQLHSGNEVYQVTSSGNAKHSISQAQAQATRIQIEYEIIQHYSHVSHDQVIKLYEPLFDAIFSGIGTDHDCLPIFTTNYDPAIETFCSTKADEYHLTDGFKHEAALRDYVWDPSAFNDFALAPHKRNIVLFKMHGSVDWIHNKNRGAIVRSQPFHQMIDSGTYKNIMIYPATNKVANDDPYYTAYDYYGRCCERSQLCVVIGYSFRDYDALSKLRSAASYNPVLKLLVIDPQAEALCANTLQSNGIAAEPVVARFGSQLEESIPHVPSFAKEADYLQKIKLALSNLRSPAPSDPPETDKKPEEKPKRIRI